MRPHGTKQELQARRMRAVALLERGMGVCDVARALGVRSGSVSRWKAMYQRAGKEGLRAKPHPGRKARMTRRQKQGLLVLLAKGPRAHGYKTDLWTLQRVADVIRNHYGISHHTSQVWRILRQEGWSCQKPERRARERDEEAVERWRREDWPRIKKRAATGAQPRSGG
jgi:transposase